MTQTREKWEFSFCEYTWHLIGMEMPWYSVCSFFCCLEGTLGKDTFTTESDFNHCYGNSSKKPFGKLLDHKYVKFFFQQLQGTFTTACWKTRHPTVEDFTDMDQDKCWFFQQEQKSTKVPWKLSIAKNATPYFKEHCIEIDDISLVIIRFFFS